MTLQALAKAAAFGFAALVLVQDPGANELGSVYLAQPGMMPAVVREVLPALPPSAEATTRRDEIDVEVVVGASGAVVHTRVVQPRADRADREQAAVDALRQWEFRPAVVAGPGKPIATLVLVRVTIDRANRSNEAPRARARLTALPREAAPERAKFDDAVFAPGSAGMRDPVLVRKIRPTYPAGASTRVTGAVKVDAVILADGTVGEARVLRPLDRDLDREALIAVRYWYFEPAVVDGKPVACKAILDLEFRGSDPFSTVSALAVPRLLTEVWH